jgi:hypothetical protein
LFDDDHDDDGLPPAWADVAVSAKLVLPATTTAAPATDSHRRFDLDLGMHPP